MRTAPGAEGFGSSKSSSTNGHVEDGLDLGASPPIYQVDTAPLLKKKKIESEWNWNPEEQAQSHVVAG